MEKIASHHITIRSTGELAGSSRRERHLRVRFDDFLRHTDLSVSMDDFDGETCNCCDHVIWSERWRVKQRAIRCGEKKGEGRKKVKTGMKTQRSKEQREKRSKEKKKERKKEREKDRKKR